MLNYNSIENVTCSILLVEGGESDTDVLCGLEPSRRFSLWAYNLKILTVIKYCHNSSKVVGKWNYKDNTTIILYARWIFEHSTFYFEAFLSLTENQPIYGNQKNGEHWTWPLQNDDGVELEMVEAQWEWSSSLCLPSLPPPAHPHYSC